MADDALQTWLKGLSGKLKRELSGKIRAQAQRLSDAQRARYEAQLQPPEDSGKGRASFRVTDGKDEVSFTVRAGGDTTTVKGYDHMVGFEFGTQKQPARPYFYNTYREMAQDIHDEIEQAVGEAIDKA